MTRILLVGDFCDCLNYGAIATTESLMTMLNSSTLEDVEIKTVTYRSIMHKTPANGWTLSAQDYLNRLMHPSKAKSIVKRVLYNMHLLDLYTVWAEELKKGNCNKIEDAYHVPIRFKDFDTFIDNIDEKLPYESKLMDWADTVIVNAEGSIVRGTSANGVYRVGGLYSLFVMYWAKKINKKCFVINHTVDPGNRDIFYMIQNIYPELDGIVVREPKSKVLLESLGIHNVMYYPDTLFAYKAPKNFTPSAYVLKTIDFSKPYICIGDSSGMSASGIKTKWNLVEEYTKLIEQLKNVCEQIVFIDGFSGKNEDILKVIRKNNLPSIGLNNADYHNLYYVLKNSMLFISGRWHSSILALLGETPILLWGSDSHKTEALYEMIDYKYRFFDVNTLPINIEEICDEAKKIIANDNSETYQKVKKLGELAINNVYMVKKVSGREKN